MRMKTQRITTIMIAALFLCSLSILGSQEAETSKIKISEIIEKFPAQSSAERDAYSAELLHYGPLGILEACRMLLPSGAGDDTKVRFALNGLAVYVSRQGAENERRLYAKTLIKALDSAAESEVRAFLISQLQLAGREESVKPLSRFLEDKMLCEPAAQALLVIRSARVEKAFLKSLSLASGANRITLIKALGELRSQAAAKKIIKYASSSDQNLRQVALSALANIGDPKSESALDSVALASSPYEREMAPSLYLLYARRLAEAGNKIRSVRICRSLIKNYTAPQESNVPCSALSTLAAILGESVFEDLLAAMDNPNKDLRLRALELAGSIQGKGATARWIERMAGVQAEAQAEIIAMLGSRGDKSALPVLLEAMRSGEKAVRLAAIPAAAKLGANSVIQDLFSILGTSEEDEIRAVKQALLGFPYELVIPKISKSFEEMPGPSKVALMEILSERMAKEKIELVYAQTKSNDAAVRLAALAALENLASENDLQRLIDILLESQERREISLAQNAAVASANLIPDLERRADLFLEALKKAPAPHQADLLLPLSRICGENAYQAVIAATKSADPLVQDAAVLTLSRWPELRAADELLAIFRSTANQKHRLLALQGYVRLANEAELSPQEKLGRLENVLGIAANVEEKRVVLSGLANVKTIESLRLVVPFMKDADLQAAAASAAARIASPQPGADKGLFGDEVISALKKAADIIQNRYERERVGKSIEAILAQEGFAPLFNGKDLSGWKGLVGNPASRTKMTPEELEKAQAEADKLMQEHWKAVDGILYFDGKGENLCTIKDYRDFELLVDWKIESQGDSGIYLRGSPQVQIWDPAQWPEGSGGLYNNKVGPSKPLKCADNPIGQWNTFRIKMVGERVTVYLNDVLVVDEVVMENYWERDKPIYSTGPIELQSHSSPLYFRNIFVREIIADKCLPVLTEEEAAEGFEPLFNGKDLSGWTGDTVGYAAEESKIVLYPDRGSGNLYTEKEFSDFILRFEFKLTPGANNGLGIRTPLTGDAAYEGMEIQILDDSAADYKDLKEYQYHGSIYGVVPAKRGYLKPVGEWNSEEVIAKGRRITVNLNGVTIVDADIDQAGTPATIDGRDHPGLKREKGHIGFLGHGYRVEFCKIRIKD